MICSVNLKIIVSHVDDLRLKFCSVLVLFLANENHYTATVFGIKGQIR